MNEPISEITKPESLFQKHVNIPLKTIITKLATPQDHRILWKTQRAALESSHAKSQRRNRSLKRRWPLFSYFLHVFGWGLKCLSLYERGLANAKKIAVREIEVFFDDLPKAFDGYRIMHLTDLHYDQYPGIEDYMVLAIESVKTPVDLAIFTGDYREDIMGPYKQILAPMQKVATSIKASDGIFATLGNHDTMYMVEGLEAMGISVLCNESLSVERNKETLLITGLDDVHYYYTDMALNALENTPKGFKILFVHSAEAHDLAEKFGYSLYLCGHTHGGQICTPWGRPIFTHQKVSRRFAKGLWKHHSMWGYTNCGTGVVGLPVRFFSESEVAILTLRRR